MGHDQPIITPANVTAALAALATTLTELEGGIRAVRTTLLASIQRIAAREDVDRELGRLEQS